ncbi:MULTISPECIES: Pvc16 family protein [Streptomyces]|nr:MULTISPECIES: Pvc16 family protein [Streptomyces]
MDSVTLSLEAWLRRCVPDAALSCEEAGPDDAGADATGVVLRVCLYDVREEDRSRGGRMFLRDAADAPVSARMEPVRILQYSYRLTAHGPRWSARQRVLGQVITAGAATPCLPDDTVDASFSGFGTGALPLVVAPAAPVPFPQAVSDAPPPWPVLHVVVMAPLRPPADTALAPAPDRVDLGARRSGSPGGGTRRTVPRQRPRIEEQGR